MEFLEVCKCIYCDEGDNLVCCSGIECPIIVHLKCVGKVAFVETDKFYCTYCRYKRGLSKFVELLKEKEIAEKEVEILCGLIVAAGGVNEGVKIGGDLVSDDGGGGDGVEETKDEENSAKDEEDGSRIRELVNDDEAADGGVVDENMDEKVDTYEHLKKRPRNITNMQPSSRRRKRSYWRSEEEDALREGVHKFESKINKNIPWRKILQFGRHVFQSGRTSEDLKDKWRSLKK